MSQDAHGASQLSRTLSFPLVIFFGMGNILGAGIYVLVGKVAESAGYNAPLAFLLASVIVSVTVFSYAELSARYPESAGEAVFLYKGFNWAWLSTLVGGVIAVAGIFSAAAIAHGFAGYVQIFFNVPKELLILALFFTLGGLAIWGVAESVGVAALFTLLEIGGLLLILWVSRDYVMTSGLFSSDISSTESVWVKMISVTSFDAMKGIYVGAFLAFYAYIGFEDMVNIAEEVKEPSRNMPRAIILCLAFSSLLYLAISVVSLLVVPLSELVSGETPLAKVYETATNKKPVFISIIAIFAVVNGALIQLIMASRVIYGMANHGWVPKFFSRISSKTKTPIRATVLVSLAMAFSALLLPIVTLAEFTSFLLLVVFSLVNLALIQIKRKDPCPQGVKVYPVWVPYLGFIVSSVFLMGQLILG